MVSLLALTPRVMYSTLTSSAEDPVRVAVSLFAHNKCGLWQLIFCEINFWKKSCQMFIEK